MFQGFYNLTSGILTQTRNLNVISNNMTNVSTPGYKSDKYLATTFKEEMMYRTGNMDKSSKTPIGTMAMIRASDETVTDYTSGNYETTNNVFDFAINGSGFFQVQMNDGSMGYTRNGSFILDDQGYLALQGAGRIMGENGPIYLNTDKFFVDSNGIITDEEGTVAYGRIATVDFADYDQLTKQANGVFTSNGAATAVNTNLLWKTVEGSNVDSIQQMVSMMSSQRNIQSAAQVMKMYDQLIGKAVTEIGKL